MNDLRQSPEGFDAKKVALVALVSITVGGIAVGVAWWTTPWSQLGRTPVATDPYRTIAGVEQGPIRGVARGEILQARARENIEGLGWTDRDARIAHIPIDRAMDMIARGCRPPGAGEPAFDAIDPSCSAAPPAPDTANAVPFESSAFLESSLGREPLQRVEQPTAAREREGQR